MGNIPTIKSVSLSDFRDLTGASLEERVGGYHAWQSSRRAQGSWIYDKTLNSALLPASQIMDGCGRTFQGPNYCSQDYLSLASHPIIKTAAKKAINDFGAHSAGCSALLGNTKLSRDLEQSLAEFLCYASFAQLSFN